MDSNPKDMLHFIQKDQTKAMVKKRLQYVTEAKGNRGKRGPNNVLYLVRSISSNPYTKLS